MTVLPRHIDIIFNKFKISLAYVIIKEYCKITAFLNFNSLKKILLLNATSTVDRDNIAKGLGKYSKSVSYFDEVKSNKAISWYCSKQLNQNIPYDLKFKEQYLII